MIFTRDTFLRVAYSLEWLINLFIPLNLNKLNNFEMNSSIYLNFKCKCSTQNCSQEKCGLFSLIRVSVSDPAITRLYFKQSELFYIFILAMRNWFVIYTLCVIIMIYTKPYKESLYTTFRIQYDFYAINWLMTGFHAH